MKLGVESGSNGSHEERALAGRIPVLRRLMDGPSLIEGRQWQGLVEGGTRGFPCLDLSLALRWTVLDSPGAQSCHQVPIPSLTTVTTRDTTAARQQPRRRTAQTSRFPIGAAPSPHQPRTGTAKPPGRSRAFPNSALAALVTLAIHLHHSAEQPRLSLEDGFVCWSSFAALS